MISNERREQVIDMLINDPEWAKATYDSMGFSEMLNHTGVSHATLVKYLKKYGIIGHDPRMSKESSDKINDKEWLIASYKKYNSFTPIANELGVSVATVSRRIKKLGIDTSRSGKIKCDVESKLSDKELLSGLYEKHNSTDKIADILGTSPTTVLRRLGEFGIVVDNKQLSSKAESFLLDKDLLESAYLEKKSTYVIADMIGVTPSTVGKYLQYHGIDIDYSNQTSLGEYQLSEFLDNHDIEYRTNVKQFIDNRLEADIVIDRHKLVIEFNGLYWHSDKYKERQYHRKKTLLVHEMGYSIIHVWEDDWNDPIKNKIIKNKILHKCNKTKHREFARKCKIIEPTNQLIRDFYNSNHIQGYVASTVSYALVNRDGDIVAMISAKRIKDKWDLSRFASSCAVIGGFSKLFKHMLSINDIKSITTYASLDYSDGNVYTKNGFELIGMTYPNYWYVDKSFKIRYSRQKFMKHKLKEKLPVFDDSLSEYENMRNNGYNRIYDCGSLKFVYNA